MITSTEHISRVDPAYSISLRLWLRFLLLFVLGYEAAGCLLGGVLLVAAPDGRYMDMPVSLMHGVFPDFLIPGILLFGLGILNVLAFISVLRKKRNDWFMTGLAMGGLVIWFVVEIIIIRELHWLHLMWGYPVLLGWVATIPLIILRNDKTDMRKALLTCGVLSSIWYVAINLFVPPFYEGYSMLSVTVSELSAINAPTRIMWVLLVLWYPILLLFFGWGVLHAEGHTREGRLTGRLIIAFSVLNFFWPPMHQREVIAAGGGTLTDTFHILWAILTLLGNILIMFYGKALLGRKFHWYTIGTWVIFLVFGILTFMESPGIEANVPTPHIGLWERINIGAFVLWLFVFALGLIFKLRVSDSTRT